MNRGPQLDIFARLHLCSLLLLLAIFYQCAQVVEMVQAVGNHIVLAVGDGANDVAMIQVRR